MISKSSNKLATIVTLVIITATESLLVDDVEYYRECFHALKEAIAGGACSHDQLTGYNVLLVKCEAASVIHDVSEHHPMPEEGGLFVS
jgi:hypothetical protein